MLIVPSDAPGFKVEPIKNMGGLNTNITFYDDVRVPVGNLVGEENKGWNLITNQLNHERVTLCSSGIVERQLEDVTAWAKEAKLADGRRVIDQEWVQMNLARVHARLEYLRLIGPAVLGAIAAGWMLPRLKTRLELSQAKHPSLSGHSRMARRIAALLPFYEYDEARFFNCDGAPADVAACRRAAFLRLAETYRQRFPKGAALTAEAAAGISDLQFTAAYRVPFQFSRYVREHFKSSAFVESSCGVTLTDIDGNPIPNASVEIWQTDEDGAYDLQKQEGVAVPEMDMRGTFHTDANGNYYLRTVLPLGYMIPMDGPVGTMILAQKRHGYRPSHIHFLVGGAGYRELVTALYWQKDAHIESDTVFGVVETLIVDVNENDPNSPMKGYPSIHYDFKLAKAAADGRQREQ